MDNTWVYGYLVYVYLYIIMWLSYLLATTNPITLWLVAVSPNTYISRGSCRKSAGFIENGITWHHKSSYWYVAPHPYYWTVLTWHLTIIFEEHLLVVIWQSISQFMVSIHGFIDFGIVGSHGNAHGGLLISIPSSYI